MSATLIPGLDVLNTGHGHAEININCDDPVDKLRGKNIIEDMLKLGYTLFIIGEDGTAERVQEFCSKTGRYIIGDRTNIPQAEPLEPEAQDMADPPAAPRKRGRPPKYAVPMDSVRPTAVGRSAGG